MHTCIHSYIHTFIHSYMHTCIHSYIHTFNCYGGALTGPLNIRDAVPYTIGEEVKNSAGVLTLTGFNQETLGKCFGTTFGADLHDGNTKLLIVHGAELRDFILDNKLDDWARLSADDLGLSELTMVNFDGNAGFALGRSANNYFLLWFIPSPGN